MLSRVYLDVVTTKTRLLTVRFNLDIYAAYAVAAEVQGCEDLSEFVRKNARASIAKAREAVGEDKFANLVEVRKQEIETRSKQKTRERKRAASNGEKHHPTKSVPHSSTTRRTKKGSRKLVLSRKEQS